MDKNETLLNRRTLLKGMGALAGLSSFSAIGLTNLLFQAPAGENVAGTSLRERAARKGLFFGSAGQCNLFNKDKEYAVHFAEECGIIVPESELKWKALRPAPDSFNFAPGDCLVEFARKNKMLFRGHTLVWHNALPDWFERTVDKQNAERFMREHIKTVVGHYSGQVHSWDVVNEAIAPWEHQPDGYRNTPWYKLLGPNYLNVAFHAAAEADPKALLVYNQNHLEYDAKGDEACRIGTLNMLKRLKSEGAPVHALGIQAHLNPEDGKFDPKIFRAFLRDVASLNLKIIITEMDVNDLDLPYDLSTRDKIVAGRYEEFLSATFEEPAVLGVLTWGMSDKYTWLSGYKPRNDKGAARPLPLDANFNRKLSWQAIARAIDSAPVRL